MSGPIRADGTPPKLQSVFGGPAWTWDARRGQYYMHNFLSSQPQVNGHHPDVQDALLSAMQFWLDRGVDGFRVDALNFLMHDPQLRDNRPAPPSDKPRTRPFDFQRRVYNQSHPDIPGFIARMRRLTDRYDAIFTVAEVGGDDAEARFLDMKVGRVENSWTGNCLAAGLAQGFLEPLEATALHIVIVTALEFASAYEQGGFGPKNRDAFNASIAARYDGIRDYIVAHYRLNRRTDTQYWRDYAANDDLSELNNDDRLVPSR